MLKRSVSTSTHLRRPVLFTIQPIFYDWGQFFKNVCSQRASCYYEELDPNKLLSSFWIKKELVITTKYQQLCVRKYCIKIAVNSNKLYLFETTRMPQNVGWLWPNLTLDLDNFGPGQPVNLDLSTRKALWKSSFVRLNYTPVFETASSHKLVTSKCVSITLSNWYLLLRQFLHD